VAGIPEVAIGAGTAAIEAAVQAAKTVTGPDKPKILAQGFRALLQRGTFSEPDLQLIREAMASGDLTAAEKRQAGMMLKAAKGGR
jgi:hypothetical protein